VIGHASRPCANVIGADFGDPRGPQALWEAALDRAGGEIDFLVNNAGLFAANPLDASDIAWLDAWEDTLRINLSAAAQLSRFAVRHWQSHGRGGRIVHVASRAGWRGDSPQHWHYAASKSAIIGMTKTIARAYASEGVLAWSVAPGFTVSEMTEEHQRRRGGAQILADIPLGRVATTTEVAEVIRWLATEAPASSTGTTIDVNGASYVR
jgi:NAD(P)-dependent dehydrogenase (short-subunit alcohol dehydrogenase family)